MDQRGDIFPETGGLRKGKQLRQNLESQPAGLLGQSPMRSSNKMRKLLADFWSAVQHQAGGNAG